MRLSRTRLLDDRAQSSEVMWKYENAAFKPTRRAETIEAAVNCSEHSEEDSVQSFDMNDEGWMFDINLFDSHEPCCIFNVMLTDSPKNLTCVGLGKMHLNLYTRGGSLLAGHCAWLIQGEKSECGRSITPGPMVRSSPKYQRRIRPEVSHVIGVKQRQ
ncbi:uncharacterized protein M421DRAFT_295319 [Didymella exigua CBS 183.55]|uniref:Uncharacterized protein n=1 Tax=Didymella exigua CBS 183.55 TaxID=1150837 RepID=A0A6A5RB76_9PLEO|nr:uncharacterized protein M421DRAFT_295319 [Didymella exigua CBS 183.55]KAF1924314.1 hypothetical protein M421DRAFT_295319 [Didymella exigua CBS 183.55]